MQLSALFLYLPSDFVLQKRFLPGLAMLSSCWREELPDGDVGSDIQAKLFNVPSETHEELQYVGRR